GFGEHGFDFIAAGTGGETGNKLPELAFRQGTHEAIHRLAVDEREDGGDRLYPHLRGELLVLIHIDLDQPNSPFGFADDLLKHGAELLAGAAPGGPEINENRNLAGSLHHVRHEILRV